MLFKELNVSGGFWSFDLLVELDSLRCLQPPEQTKEKRDEPVGPAAAAARHLTNLQN